MSNEAKGMTLVMTAMIMALGLVGSLEIMVDISAKDATMMAVLGIVGVVSGLLGLSYLES